MTKFDQRIAANLEVALATVCRKLPNGGRRTPGVGPERPYDMGELEAVGRGRCGRQTAGRPSFVRDEAGAVRP
jgi:hypothetical protein